jgi:hypothetical protein
MLFRHFSSFMRIGLLQTDRGTGHCNCTEHNVTSRRCHAFLLCRHKTSKQKFSIQTYSFHSIIRSRYYISRLILSSNQTLNPRQGILDQPKATSKKRKKKELKQIATLVTSRKCRTASHSHTPRAQEASSTRALALLLLALAVWQQCRGGGGGRLTDGGDGKPGSPLVTI